MDIATDKKCDKCPDPARPNKTLCEPCAIKNRNDTKNRKASYKAKGLCKDCGDVPPVLGKTCCEKCASRNRLYAAQNADRSRDLSLRRNYNITLERYTSMLREQDGKCVACGTTDPGGHGTFHVDHCHTTGTVRELLCTSCNLALGMLQESPERFRALADYIERHRVPNLSQVD